MRRTNTWAKTLVTGKDWQQEKGTTENEMGGWCHRINEYEFERAPGVDGTEKSGVLQIMGLQRVGHDWGTAGNLVAARGNEFSTPIEWTCWNTGWLIILSVVELCGDDGSMDFRGKRIFSSIGGDLKFLHWGFIKLIKSLLDFLVVQRG